MKIQRGSVVDPDPKFWPNLNPDPGFCIRFLKEKSKITLERKKFLLIQI